MSSGQHRRDQPCSFYTSTSSMNAFDNITVRSGKRRCRDAKGRFIRTTTSISRSSVKFLDLTDDIIAHILSLLIGPHELGTLRTRSLRDVLNAYELAKVNQRVCKIFRQCFLKKVHTIDSLYPNGLKPRTWVTQACTQPESVAILSAMAGDSLRILHVEGLVSPSRAWIDRASRMIGTVAKHCSQLEELVLQDFGAVDTAVATQLLSRNRGLKRIAVDVPGSDLIHSLVTSECALEDVMLLRVQTSQLEAVQALLRVKGNSIRFLSIETCPDFSSSASSQVLAKARHAKLERDFVEELGNFARTKLHSLRRLRVVSETMENWVGEFAPRTRAALRERADLLIGVGWGRDLYPARSEAVLVKPCFGHLSLDNIISTCRHPGNIARCLASFHQPRQLSLFCTHILMGFDSGIPNDSLSEGAEEVVMQKCSQVEALFLEVAISRMAEFEKLNTLMQLVLGTMERAGRSPEKITDVRISLHVIAFLGQGLGGVCFLKRLRNLRLLRITWPIERNFVILGSVPKGIPLFLQYVSTSFPRLECIHMQSVERLRGDIRSPSFQAHIYEAQNALARFEKNSPLVDASSLRRQVTLWSSQNDCEMREPKISGAPP